ARGSAIPTCWPSWPPAEPTPQASAETFAHRCGQTFANRFATTLSRSVKVASRASLIASGPARTFAPQGQRNKRSAVAAAAHEETFMIIHGPALLALCPLLGIFLGDALGALLGVKTNVGGVGIAMLLLIFARLRMEKANQLPKLTELGVEYWGAMYI